MTDRLLPVPDRDSKEWWAAVARHELVHQRCSSCGRWRWPPRALCSDCGSFEWTWQLASGQGTVVSFIRTHHSFLPSLAAPYYTVFVAADEQDDIIMPGSWHSSTPPAVDLRVQVHYDDIATEDGTVALVGWQPAEEEQ